MSPTQYTYTGQYSYTADFGLMFYNARWYDPYLKRFAQADTIVPPGAQGLDRYLYALNSPIQYKDPSGHCQQRTNRTMVTFTSEGQDWTQQEMDVVCQQIYNVAIAEAKMINSRNYLLWRMGEIDSYRPIGPSTALYTIHNGPIEAVRSNETPGWAAYTRSENEIVFYNIRTPDGTIITNYVANHPRLVTHEMGHAVINAFGINEATDINIPSDLLRPLMGDSSIDHLNDINGAVDPNEPFFGYAGGFEDYQFGYIGSRWREEFADMFVGWVYHFGDTPMGAQRNAFMQLTMVNLVDLIP
ncbi:MAG: hypothetical protein HND47_20050 [Chloroflexi bacterium]|nr:hypothetical protein [Chloroflexota bacterium]